MFISKIIRDVDHSTDADDQESLQAAGTLQVYATRLIPREHPLADALEGETREFEEESTLVFLTRNELKELREWIERVEARLSKAG